MTFNCQSHTRFYSALSNLVDDNSLVLTDTKRLSNAFTYYSDAGSNMSRIDHVLCSPGVDSLVCNVEVLTAYITCDHKPLAVTFSSLVCRDPCVLNNGGIVNNRKQSVVLIGQKLMLYVWVDIGKCQMMPCKA